MERNNQVEKRINCWVEIGQSCYAWITSRTGVVIIRQWGVDECAICLSKIGNLAPGQMQDFDVGKHVGTAKKLRSLRSNPIVFIQLQCC